VRSSIRPTPTAELDGRVICEIDGEPLFRTADAATVAVDALVRAGRLLEQAIDDHDVRKQYANGAERIAEFADARRQLPDRALPRLRALAQLLRRARALPATATSGAMTPRLRRRHIEFAISVFSGASCGA